MGIPSEIDNAMFQIGKLFTQSLIASFGTASIIIMWIFRIGFAYLLTFINKKLGSPLPGVLCVWIAMTIDWFVRCISNITRIKSGKWMKKAVV